MTERLSKQILMKSGWVKTLQELVSPLDSVSDAFNN